METVNRRTFLGGLGSAAIAATTVGHAAEAPKGGLVLWYRQPAKLWVEALPVGNGRLGAMVFGGVERERLQLNEDTIWDGFRRDVTNPAALQALPEVRRLLFAGKNEEATKLSAATMMGVPMSIKSYQPLGDLLLEMADGADVEQYRRELDLETGVATVRYGSKGATFTREVFASKPDQVIVVRVSADKPGRINLSVKFERRKRRGFPE